MFGELGKLETKSMNTSLFMDKQIMDLSSSHNKSTSDKDFMDLNSHPSQDNHHQDVVGGDGDDDKNNEILPNYDFQPIRPSQPSNFESSNVGGARVRGSGESKCKFGTRSYGSLDSVEPSKVVVEKDRTVFDAALLSEIDRTMKKYVDNLMHALEGLSARLSQLESRSRSLENSVDDLRTSVGNNHGNTDGKLRHIENIMREVQAGVQVVKDKQEILEAQLQLSQIQVSKPKQQPESQIAEHMESLHQPAASAHLQPHHHLPLPTLPNAPPPPNPQNLVPPPVQHSNQFSQNIMPMAIPHPQHDSYYPPPGQTAAVPPQQHQLPPPPPPAQQPQYPPPTQTQYPQPPPMTLQPPSHSNTHPSPAQTQPPLNHHSEEFPYSSSQFYPPNIRQPGGGLPPQFPSQTYEPPGRAGFGEPFNYGGSQYGSRSGSPMKSQQPSSPNMGHGGGSGYPQLPTARILPHALPTGGSSSSSGSGNSGNRVPIDDVVDKVTNMGFPREQVRATVRKLTENGQAVDLNVVLDKLMTDGVESQGPRPWFGR